MEWLLIMGMFCNPTTLKGYTLTQTQCETGFKACMEKVEAAAAKAGSPTDKETSAKFCLQSAVKAD